MNSRCRIRGAADGTVVILPLFGESADEYWSISKQRVAQSLMVEARCDTSGVVLKSSMPHHADGESALTRTPRGLAALSYR